MKSDKTTPNVPTLRFQEFTNPWTLMPLKKLLCFQNGINADSAKYGKGVKFISVSDILNNQYITYDCIKGMIDIDKKTMERFLVEYGDILFQRSSETFEDIGRANVYLDKEHPATFGGFVIRGKKISEYNPMFFRYLLCTPNARKQTVRMGAGAQHYNIGQDGLGKISLYFPTIQEQQKIAGFLSAIDDRISVQNKIIEDLKVLKKELCKVILNNKGWPKFRIRDIANLGRGRVINTDEINSQRSPIYPVYSSQTSNNGIMGYLDQYDFEGEYITWTTDGANAGTVFYRNGRFNCTNVCGTLKLTVDFDYYITALSIQMVTEKYVSKNLANPKLMNNVMAEIEIFMPDVQTQKSLSSLFISLDKKIESAGELLSCFVSEKKFLLNAIFI